MVYNEALHPRNKIGEYRQVGLTGWQTYKDRRGQTHEYYINNQNELKNGALLLARTTSQESAVMSRIHVTATDDGETMMMAASQYGTMMLVDHDLPGPRTPFTYEQSSQFQQIVEAHRRDETAMGGHASYATTSEEAAQTPVLHGMRAVRLNDEAFHDGGSRVIDAVPQDVATAIRDCRHTAIHQYGYTAEQARRMKIRLGFDSQGKPVVTPYIIGQDVEGHPLYSPKRGPMVTMRADRLCHELDALQGDIPDMHVKMTIRRGSEGSDAALYVRRDFENTTDGHYMTLMGMIEPDDHHHTQLPATVTVGATQQSSDTRHMTADMVRRRKDARIWKQLHSTYGIPVNKETVKHHQESNGSWVFTTRSPLYGDQTTIADRRGVIWGGSSSRDALPGDMSRDYTSLSRGWRGSRHRYSGKEWNAQHTVQHAVKEKHDKRAYDQMKAAQPHRDAIRRASRIAFDHTAPTEARLTSITDLLNRTDHPDHRYHQQYEQQQEIVARIRHGEGGTLTIGHRSFIFPPEKTPTSRTPHHTSHSENTK